MREKVSEICFIFKMKLLENYSFIHLTFIFLVLLFLFSREILQKYIENQIKMFGVCLVLYDINILNNNFR